MVPLATKSRRSTAALCEVFLSLQGEGPSVGLPTAFVRSAGCPLRCSYCDSVYSYKAPEAFELRDFDGTRLGHFDNPASAGKIVQALTRSPGFPGLAYLSFTGGEPLLWPGFGYELFREARMLGLRTHLETAAIDAEALAVLLPLTEHLAMDWKLPSTIQGKDYSAAHLLSLRAALDHGCEVSVKIVLPSRDEAEEYERALDMLSEVEGRFELVLQPITPCLDEQRAPDSAELMRRLRAALELGFSPRVLPQVHKLMGFE